jgi:hypothetical protein
VAEIASCVAASRCEEKLSRSVVAFRGLLDMLVVSVLAETRAKDAIASEGEGAVAIETKTASAPMAAYVLFHTNLSA